MRRSPKRPLPKVMRRSPKVRRYRCPPVGYDALSRCLVPPRRYPSSDGWYLQPPESAFLLCVSAAPPQEEEQAIFNATHRRGAPP